MAVFLKTLATHPIILLFLLANLAIGFWAHRQSKANSFEDYALASRSLPTGVLVMTLLATYVASFELSHPYFPFKYGLLYGLDTLFYVVSFFIMGSLIAPCLVYFQGVMTQGALMRNFYGAPSQIITGFVGSLAAFFVIIMQLRVIGTTSSRLLGINFSSAIIFFGIFVLLYSVWGGMRSISYTDVLQLVCLLVVFTWIAQVVIDRVEGVKNLFQKLYKHHPEKLSFTSHPKFNFRIKGALIWAFAGTEFFSLPISQRMLITQDKREVRRMWYISGFFYALICFLVLLIGLSAIVLKTEFGFTNKSKNLLLDLIEKLFNNESWAIECIFVGFLGIMLSTMDSYLHAIGVSFVQDLVEPLREYFGISFLSAGQKVIYAKIGMVLVGILAILWALQGESPLMNFTINKYTLLVSSMIIAPLIIGIVGVKTNKSSLLSFCITYVLCLVVFIRLRWHLYDYFLIALPLGLIAYFLTHIYLNGGIVTLKRSEQTIAEQLWIPTWQGAIAYVKGWLLAPFRLHILASSKIVNNPIHSLSFSMLIFAFYTFSSVMTGGGSDLELANFMAGVHVVGISLCVGLMLEGIWSDRLKPYFALYWFFTLFYCLSFGSTLTFLRDHKSTIAVGKWIASFMFLAFLVDSTSFITLSCLGSGLALVFWYIVVGSFPADLLGSVGLLGGFLLVALLLAVLLFEHSRERDLKERFYLKSAFSHAMTHESTQPLSEIDVLAIIHQRIMDEMLPMQNVQGEKGFWIPASKQGMMQQGNQQIGKAVQEIKHEFLRFNKLIEDEIGTLEKEKVSIRSLVESIIPTLPRRHTERVKVKVKCTKDFKASLIRPLFGNVYANFLKNAYLHGNASEMHIHIDGGGRKIHVRDNGMGIKAELLPRIFDLHFTTGGQASSGVGLALVKIIVQASGGKISCHSRYGDKDSFTEFVIEFPEIE